MKSPSLAADISSCSLSFELAAQMPAAIKQAAQHMGGKWRGKNIAAGRADLRDLPFVTIDGPQAKDFDDAICCRANADGSHALHVAISDVAEFVPSAGVIDREAVKRANSTYFPCLVLPMLPAVLSEGMCSLLAKQERLALVCSARISPAGRVVRYEFRECVIQSAARLTYAEAERQLASPARTAIGGSLSALAGLTRVLLQAKTQRGALSLELSSREAVIGDGAISGFRWSAQLFAHKMIEESMLVANCCAARFLAERQVPLLYRVHHEPEPAKVLRLRQLLAQLGVRLGKTAGPQALQAAVDRCAKLAPLVRRVVVMNVLRTLQRAVYTPRNGGHYALQSDRYAHFTSPIRRYPDLLVHRAIKSVLHGKQPDRELDLEAIGAHCTERELASERAAQEVLARQFARRQADRIGQTMAAAISGMSRAGMFVATEDGLDGLVRFSSLPDDYYELNDMQVAAVGRRRKRRFVIGQQVTVSIAKINEDDGRCQMALH